MKYSREMINKNTMMSLFILMSISSIIGFFSTPEQSSMFLSPQIMSQIVTLFISIILFIFVYFRGLNKFVHIGSISFYYVILTAMLIFLGTSHLLGLIFILLLSMVIIVSLDGKTQWSFLMLVIVTFIILSIYQIVVDVGNVIAVFTWSGFSGIALTIVGIVFILSQNKHLTIELLEKTKTLTMQDYLTSVRNNKALCEDINLLNFDLERYNHTYCLVFLDINKFKDINDLYGHIVGDQVLINFVESLKKHIRETDNIYRVGGDEFVLLFKESELDDIMKKMNSLGNFHFLIQGHDISVSFSYGLVQQSNPPKDLNVLIKEADKLMYKNKLK